MAERDPTPDSPDAVTDAPKRGRWRMLLLLIPVVLLPAVGGGYIAYEQYPHLLATATSFGFGTDDAEADADKPIEYGQFIELEGLIVNPAGTDGKRYLMVNIGLEGPSEDVLAEVQSREVVVRDTILKVLGRRSVTELSDVALRNELKAEILDAVNAITRKGKIDRMYFTQYVLQ